MPTSTAIVIISAIFSFLSFVLIMFLFFRQMSQKSDFDHLLKLDRKLKTKIAKKIEQEADEQLKNVLLTMQNRLEGSLSGVINSLTENSNKQISDLANYVREQQKALVKESQYMVASAIDKTEKELAGYKEQRKKEIDVKIFEIIRVAAKEVLGKNINPNENEALVEEAIERAKQEKFFS